MPQRRMSSYKRLYIFLQRLAWMGKQTVYWRFLKLFEFRISRWLPSFYGQSNHTKKYEKQILKLLLTNHYGVIRFKQLARKTVYGFGINTYIEKYVANCDACNNMPIVHKPKESFNWTPTTRPFSRIHINFSFSNTTYICGLWIASPNVFRWKEWNMVCIESKY